MARKVLDSNVSDADIDALMDTIIAQNPQLNAQIERVSNESNVFLCRILRIYPYEDKALVRVLDTGQNIFCRLSHEVLGREMCIDYLPQGNEKFDYKNYSGKKYIEPYSALFGIVIKVRWKNLEDENVFIGYVNIYDHDNLKSSNDTGEISLKSGQSTLSVDNDRVNIMTPSLFINGLPFTAPELENYYNKKESDVIINDLNEKINELESKMNDDSNLSCEELIETSENYKKNSDEEYYLFRGDCWTINNNFESSASIVSQSKTDFTVNGTFRTNSDLIEIYWNSKDIIQHSYISYGNRTDYTNVVLEFDYGLTGCTEFTDDSINITFTMVDNSVYNIKLNTFIKNNHVKIVFNDIVLSQGDKYINSKGTEVTIEEETHLNVKNIKNIKFVLIPDNYNKTQYKIIENVNFVCSVENISVTNGYICNEHINIKSHKYRLCEKYDDIYKLNPFRLCKEMKKLGYTKWVDLDIGASYFYDKKGTVGDTINPNNFNETRINKMVLDDEENLNNAFSSWLNCYSGELKKNGFENLIISISMEILQCPAIWKQKTSSDDYAVTDENIPITYYSPCNVEAITYIKSIVRSCLDINVSNGLRPILQLKNGSWWWNKFDKPNQPPCFYDESTKNTYQEEFKKQLPLYSSSKDDFDVKVIRWLNQQILSYSKKLRKIVKEYDDGLYLALLSVPLVLDEDDVPVMMQKANYVENMYNPEHIDILQLCDYEWVINEKTYHNGVYNLGQKLGFSVDKLHYYGGFVQYPNDAVKLWRLINTSMKLALNKGFGEIYVWAGSQIRRDNKFIGNENYELIQHIINN